MNVTLKDFPDELHSTLKALAEENGRSLNRQIINTLQSATRATRTDEAVLLQRITANRQKMNGTITPELLESAIADGRP